jgi:signal transduction histidine kinase
MPADILPRVFESFVSSKAADTGTGLGLSIARRAIEGMGGRIYAENGPSGAIFTINLPILVQKDLSCIAQ